MRQHQNEEKEISKILISETQASREEKLIALIKKNCPKVVLHSKIGENIFNQSVPRLRFDKKIRFKAFFKIFSQIETTAFVVTKPNNTFLDLSRDWEDIEIKVYNPDFLGEAKKIALAYQKFINRRAAIILSPVETQSEWLPLFKWLLCIVIILGVLLGIRLLTSIFLINALRNLFHF